MSGVQDKKVGFIGLGLMGGPIAANMARAGADLVVWNRSPEKAETLARQVGVTVAADPVELARHADVLITMVADGNVLEEVFSTDGFIDALGAGSVVIDMSTIGPTAANAIAERLAAAGVEFVDAPVSGSIAAATEAQLAIFAGATPELFERVKPYLEPLGKSVERLGDQGQAAIVKLAINNLIYGINQCLSESLILAERAGIDRRVAYDAFLGSAASAPVMGYRKEAFLEPEDAPTSLSVRLGDKDLRLTLELADAVGAPMPQAALNRRVTREAIAAGFGEDDVSAVAQYLRAVGEANRNGGKG